MTATAKRKDVISQKELRELHNLEAEYHDAKSRYLAKPDDHSLEERFLDLRAEYQAQRARIKSRIHNGAIQSAGKYAIRPKTYYRRSVSYKAVVIRLRGEKYQQDLLARAKPKAYTRLEFEDIGGNR